MLVGVDQSHARLHPEESTRGDFDYPLWIDWGRAHYPRSTHYAGEQASDDLPGTKHQLVRQGVRRVNRVVRLDPRALEPLPVVGRALEIRHRLRRNCGNETRD